MNRVRIVMLSLLVLLLMGGTFVVAGQDNENNGEKICFPIGTITLKAPEGVEMKRNEVDFPHSRHFGYQCQTCHHKWDGTYQIPSCMASNCHDLIKTPENTDEHSAETDLDIRYYKSAFHNSCIGCHKELKVKNKALSMSSGITSKSMLKTGPTGCVKCHPKE